jgi:DNA topoisomerase VI subunit B
MTDQTTRRKKQTLAVNGTLPNGAAAKQIQRIAFQTSRLLDFCSRKELIAQTGHQPDAWSLVLLKELLDNALDACEDAGAPPCVVVTVDGDGVTVSDNGPGIPPETVEGVLDFNVRISSREAYVSPTRGAQGNALKTIVAMPFALDAEAGGLVEIAARGVRHEIALRVDRLRQKPVIDHRQRPDEVVTNGTSVRVSWPDSSRSILTGARERFLQIAHDYAILNPHLNLTINWHGEGRHIAAVDPSWKKWLPGDPTSPHWYDRERFERYLTARIVHDADQGRDRTVREIVAEFDGLTASAKQTKVLDAVGLKRVNLSTLVNNGDLDHEKMERLLAAMRDNSKPVKPQRLGLLGKERLQRRFLSLGCQPESFNYKCSVGTTDGVPWVRETAFGYCPEGTCRRIITGVNWSPGILNPFRELGRFGESMDSVLERCRVGRDEPVVILLHLACPRVEYTDRGKSAVVIGGDSDEEGRD